jgi:hypothetical protein
MIEHHVLLFIRGAAVVAAKTTKNRDETLVALCSCYSRLFFALNINLFHHSAL